MMVLDKKEMKFEELNSVVGGNAVGPVNETGPLKETGPLGTGPLKETGPLGTGPLKETGPISNENSIIPGSLIPPGSLGPVEPELPPFGKTGPLGIRV